MKNWVVALGASAAVFGTASARAETRGGFEVGAEAFDYAYRERVEGETIVFDDGTFGGARLDYVETVGGGTFLRSRLHVAFGSVDYRSSDGERLEDVSQSISQLELQVGHDYSIGRGATVTPFIGLGGRVLEDESGGKETESGLLGYDREISYSYVPVGAAAVFELGGSTELMISGQYNWVIGGEVRSDLRQVDPELPNLKLEIDKGHGLEASAMLGFGLGGSRVAVGPFVRYWSVQPSDTFTITNPDDPSEAIEFFEPASRTTEIGVRLGFAF